MLITRADLQSAWNDTAARFDFAGDKPARLLGATGEPAPERALEDRVEERLTERAATFEPGEFRAVPDACRAVSAATACGLRLNGARTKASSVK